MITSSLAFYPCGDLAAAQEFYTQVIGLRLVFSTDTVRVFGCAQGYVGFVYYGKPETAGPHVCISFNCASEAEVDREYQRICQLGYPTKAPPARHPTQPVYSFFLQDPNGYTVEFEKLEGLAL